MKNLQTYYYKEIPDSSFGIDIFLVDTFKKGRKIKEYSAYYLYL